jgi:hypothetical protein
MRKGLGARQELWPPEEASQNIVMSHGSTLPDGGGRRESRQCGSGNIILLWGCQEFSVTPRLVTKGRITLAGREIDTIKTEQIAISWQFAKQISNVNSRTCRIASAFF